MRTVVFVGPTLARGGAARLPGGMEALPPVAFGDVYRAASAGAGVIGIIDGYFEQVPSVWHKEILWAMGRGVHVLGSASMGALRAAELAAFGMEGVGRIFEAFRDGHLTDDDEVAVRHGPAALGYPPASEAMVNIRATLERAAVDRVVTPGCAEAVVRAAKALFYGDRTFERAIAAAHSAGADGGDLPRLEAWLPAGRVDQKRADAEEMLAEIERRLRLGLAPKRVDFEFEHTSMWTTARAHFEQDGSDEDPHRE